MTTDSRRTATSAEHPAPTPARGASRRRTLAWTAIIAFVLLVGSAGALLSGIGTWTERDRLDPESVGPGGTAALVAILREQGVTVTVTRDRTETLRLLKRAPTTLVMSDSPILGDDALRELINAATDVVLVDPQARGVDLLFPDATAAAFAPAEAVDPECDAEPALRAGPVMPGRLLVPDTSGGSPSTVVACYPAGVGFGLLIDSDAEGVLSAFDGRDLITNERLAVDGNAALALNLMGRLPTLVWYVPSLSDSDITADPTLGELTPGWVTPAIVLLLTAGVVAGVWRGRRFGPLVSETLPVTVRAAETTIGRGRLYARSRDAEHAAVQLRGAALRRLSRILGLGPTASAPAVADAAARLLGVDPGPLRTLLLTTTPRTDRELVDFSDRLHELEAAVRAAVRPEGTPR